MKRKRLRIAHLGGTSIHKGWSVFERLALAHAQDERYEFYHLGADSKPLPYYVFKAVQVTPDDPKAMAEAVSQHCIDVVLCWSLWPETFCFTAHEALAGGAFVIARRDAGNVWPAVQLNAAGQGYALDDEASLFELFRTGELRRLVQQSTRLQGSLVQTELPGMLDEFAAGVLLARLMVSPGARLTLAKLPGARWVVSLVAALLTVAALHIYWGNSTYWNNAWMVIAFKSLLAITCAMIVLSACLLQSSIAIRLTAPLRYLGTISYGIYLWHLLVIVALRRVPWVSGSIALPWVIGLTLVLASLSWHFFERPLMRRFGAHPRSTVGSYRGLDSEPISRNSRVG